MTLKPFRIPKMPRTPNRRTILIEKSRFSKRMNSKVKERQLLPAAKSVAPVTSFNLVLTSNITKKRQKVRMY